MLSTNRSIQNSFGGDNQYCEMMYHMVQTETKSFNAGEVNSVFFKQ